MSVYVFNFTSVFDNAGRLLHGAANTLLLSSQTMALGQRLEANLAALLGMTVNLGAYASEILRAGVASVPRGQIEAGRALGLRPRQVFLLVVLVVRSKRLLPKRLVNRPTKSS